MLCDHRISRHRQTNRHAYHQSKTKFRKDLPFFKRLWTKDDRRTAGTAIPPVASILQDCHQGRQVRKPDFSRPGGTPIIHRPRAARFVKT